MASRAVTPPSSPRRWSGSRARTSRRSASLPAPTRSPPSSRRLRISSPRPTPTVSCPLHLLLRRRKLRRITLPRLSEKSLEGCRVYVFGGAQGGECRLLSPFDHSWDSRVQPIRDFQTVSEGKFCEVRGCRVLESSGHCPGVPWGTLGSKNIRTSEAAPVKRGDRQPVRQSLVVP